jgi:hypothetical protein
MRRLIACSYLAALGYISSGCDSQCGGTTVGGAHYFPPGSDRDSRRMTLHVSVEGERGKAYVATSPKRIYLSVDAKNGTTLLKREYTVVAGDLEWKADWTDPSQLHVVFFEFMGPGPEVARTVFSLAFESQGLDGSYLEGHVPRWVAASVASDLDLENQRQIFVLRLALTADNQKAALSVVRTLSKKLGMRSMTIPPHGIGPLAEYTMPGLRLEVTRYDSQGVIQITVEDWDRKQDSEAIRNGLAELSIVSTRRVGLVSALLGSGGSESVLAAIRLVAANQGLLQDDDPAPAHLASYRLPAASDATQDAVALTAFRLSSPDRLHVRIEDLDSRQKGLEVERAVRDALAQLMASKPHVDPLATAPARHGPPRVEEDASASL